MSKSDMKIYTKTGDKGETSLIGGDRVAKTDIRIEAIGAVDLVNAQIGIIVALLISRENDLKADLIKIQNDLFVIGATLAEGKKPTKGLKLPSIAQEDVAWLEKQIDQYDSELEPLRNFILPGGHLIAAHLQSARSLTREAERRILAVHQVQSLPDALIAYMNRLSDYLFTVSRLINKRYSQSETIWQSSDR